MGAHGRSVFEIAKTFGVIERGVPQASVRARACRKRNDVFGARFKGLSLCFLYKERKSNTYQHGLGYISDTYPHPYPPVTVPPLMIILKHYTFNYIFKSVGTSHQGGPGSVRLRFGCGTVRAVLVFGFGGSSWEGFSCVSVQIIREGRLRFRF